MTRYILGISCYYHDSAACLLQDGRIVAAAQQERFSRVKHDAAFPTAAIQYCLAEAGIELSQLSAVVFYDKPFLKFERLLETYLAHAPRGFRSFLAAMPVWLKEKLYLKTVLRRELRQLAGVENNETLPRLLFSQHHQAHAASAFYASPYHDAAVICLDGVGEWATSTLWHGKGNQLTPLAELHFPHSLGLLYSAFTYYCGFKVNSGEYKLMGLAPYGQPRFVDILYRELIDVKADGSFALNMTYFAYPVGSRMINQKFERLFGAPALAPDATPSQHYLDVAASIQQVTEDIVLKIARYAQLLTGANKVCLAGGVALNCVANGRLLREGPFQALWIQPAAGDAGGALGAALLAWYQYYDQPRHSDERHDQMQGAYLGPAYTDAEIITLLEAQQVPYQLLSGDERSAQVSALLAAGKVVGWFQGRMEFGPRALGNRSILGDARSPKMQSVLNLKIKQRESFRPFAPAILAEHAAQYFDLATSSPYMLLVAALQPAYRIAPDTDVTGLAQQAQVRSCLPAITHVDYSARVQTVDAHSNPEFYQLLQAFKALTGTPILINTSFNVRGEPPVCSPFDALQGFWATDMDYLVLGNTLLSKAAQNPEQIAQAQQRVFAAD
ncbi:carbamoyltransferase family protein [Alishewanella tabrizica]|uniref:Carbamoyltransferase n=1 Tax=Alishewanella tabrizica TaxID=671278 RepID=A0ABQ2WNW4_9ALTE|nr:carbamoyltransferase [Alishewanella tabrizica]GGW60771.1 carbamoyltransferase [Alishewanella tabrizica]